MYRNKGEERFVPARFNLALVQQQSGSEPPHVLKSEQANWLQTSLIIDAVGMEHRVLPRGSYTLILMA